jgi:hypothetical protein
MYVLVFVQKTRTSDRQAILKKRRKKNGKKASPNHPTTTERLDSVVQCLVSRLFLLRLSAQLIGLLPTVQYNFQSLLIFIQL